MQTDSFWKNLKDLWPSLGLLVLVIVAVALVHSLPRTDGYSTGGEPLELSQ